MLEQCCSHSKQCCNNVAKLCWAKNRRCKSSRLISPVVWNVIRSSTNSPTGNKAQRVSQVSPPLPLVEGCGEEMDDISDYCSVLELTFKWRFDQWWYSMFTLLFTLNRRIWSLNWIPSHSLELLRMEVTWLICVMGFYCLLFDYFICWLPIFVLFSFDGFSIWGTRIRKVSERLFLRWFSEFDPHM